MKQEDLRALFVGDEPEVSRRKSQLAALPSPHVTFRQTGQLTMEAIVK
jgi:hypothetical protein